MSARTVILLHGLMCDETVWAHQRAVLSRHYDVLIPDLQNFDSLEAMAQFALDAAPGPAHVVGHSMGGRVAWEIVRLAPERVRSLVVLDTGVHAVSDGEPEARRRFLDLADSGGMEAVVDAWLPPMLDPARRDDRDVIDPLRTMVMGYRVDQFKGQIRALLERTDATSMLPTISCPVLVICGRHDGFSPLARHEDFAALIPGAELAVVEDAGHMVTIEQPEAVTALLVDWLVRIDPATVEGRAAGGMGM